MSVFHFFKIVQMLTNRATYHIYKCNTNPSSMVGVCSLSMLMRLFAILKHYNSIFNFSIGFSSRPVFRNLIGWHKLISYEQKQGFL